jgi:hypothetical protein
MYKILGADQKEYGPVTAEVVRQWIAQGRANAQTRAQAEGSAEWKPLSEFPEFKEAFASAATPAPTPAMPASVGARRAEQKKGMAIASLVLGVLSLCGCLVITGLPAIILGHIAHNRARKSPGQYGGAGMAIAGFIMGYLGLAVTLLLVPAGLILPALAKAKGRAQSINCVSNLKQIGLAARIYSNDHKETFPPDFLTMSNELATPKVLCCPGDTRRSRAMTWAECSEANISYEYLAPGAKEESVLQQPVFRCPIHGHVGFGDGSVQQGGGRTRL